MTGVKTSKFKRLIGRDFGDGRRGTVPDFFIGKF